MLILKYNKTRRVNHDSNKKTIQRGTVHGCYGPVWRNAPGFSDGILGVSHAFAQGGLRKVMGFNSKAESDWDADVDHERKEWLAVRQSELVNLGYHPATAYVVAVREWNALHQH